MTNKIILQQLRKHLDEYLKVAEFTDFCPNGLQVEGKKEIRKVATAVSLSIEVIEKSISKGIDALIVHHGLFWKGDSFVIDGAKRKKLELLLKHDISLFAYHLPLDAHRECGNNWKAAQDLGWEELVTFNEIGIMGRCPAMSLSQLTRKLEKYYDHPATVADGGGKKIERVALVSGGAYKDLKKAALAGADAFVTGNFDEPAWWVAREEGIHFLALGHSATERVGVVALAEHVKEQFSLKVEFLDIFNPF
jgi:dinuclear metal center YbgI/SA1388 family protein